MEPLAHDLEDRRPPLVLLHPFPFDRSYWRPQLADLADLVPLIAVDLPGFGSSPPLPGEPSLDAWADAVEATLAARLGERPAVVAGLSMGGYVALRLAARHPARIEALVLADTRASADTPEGRSGRDAAIAAVRERGVAPLVEELLPRLLAPDADPEAVAAARSIASRQRPDAVAAALAAMRDRPDSTRVLERLEAPLLVIVGERDALTPPEAAAEMAAAARDSWLVKIPGAGHLSSLEAPEAFDAAVAGFLAGL